MRKCEKCCDVCKIDGAKISMDFHPLYIWNADKSLYNLLGSVYHHNNYHHSVNYHNYIDNNLDTSLCIVREFENLCNCSCSEYGLCHYMFEYQPCM